MKKKLFSACPFLSLFCLLLLVRHHFFVHSGFLLIIKEKEGTFIHTHTRTEERLLKELLQREREKKIMGKKEVRFVSFRYNRKGGVKKTFAARDDEESSFF